MNNQVDEKVSKEPGDVINPDVHACYKHWFSNFFLFLFEHERCLPQVYDK